jgi:DNA-binding beta-propeller fold protein YncE
MARQLTAVAALAACAGATLSLDGAFNPTKGLTELEVTAVSMYFNRTGGSLTPTVVVAQRGLVQPFVTAFDYAGEATLGAFNGSLTSPHGLLAADSTLWVADIAAFTIKSFDAAGNLLKTVGTPGVGGSGLTPIQFSAPADVAIDAATSTLFVSDGDGGSNSRVVALDMSASYKTKWAVGGAGSAPGKFSSPHSVAWDGANGLAWVADRGNNRLQALAGADGSVVAVWNTTSCLGGAPWGVRVDSVRGFLYVADGASGSMWAVRLPTVAPGGGLTPCPGPAQTFSVCPAGGALEGCKPHLLGLDVATGDVYLAAVGTPATKGPTFVQRYTYSD